MSPAHDEEIDPEWCPECEERTARAWWSDDKDWPLTPTFIALEDSESISLRRRCLKCGWREVRQLTASIEKQGIPESSETKSDPDITTLDDLFD